MEYSDVIKNISYSQNEILRNIMVLHNNNEVFEVDMTYSCGNFYKVNKDGIVIPQPKYKLDVVPQFEDVIKIEPLGQLPFEDNSISSIVIDLPFVIAPKNAPSLRIENEKDSRNIIIKRFAAYYPINEMLESYYHWINEAYRVLKQDGICVFKCQNTITSAKQVTSTEYAWLCATLCGFYTLDEFVLLAKNRLHSSKIIKQQHARKYSSIFYVFKKTDKKKTKLFGWVNDEQKEKLIDNFINI